MQLVVVERCCPVAQCSPKLPSNSIVRVIHLVPRFSTLRHRAARSREGGKEEGEGRMVAQFREVTRFCHVITSVVKEALRGASKRARISRARFRTRGIRATVPPVIPWLKSNFNVTAGNLANTAANFLARANHLRVDSLERERERGGSPRLSPSVISNRLRKLCSRSNSCFDNSRFSFRIFDAPRMDV